MSVLKMVIKQMPIFSYYNSYTKFLQVFVCYGFYPVCVITISQWTQTAMVYHRLCMGYLSITIHTLNFYRFFACYGFYPVWVITISQWTQTAMVYHRLCMGYQIMHYLKISCTVKCKITHMLGEHYLLYVITDYSFSHYVL